MANQEGMCLHIFQKKVHIFRGPEDFFSGNLKLTLRADFENPQRLSHFLCCIFLCHRPPHGSGIQGKNEKEASGTKQKAAASDAEMNARLRFALFG